MFDRPYLLLVSLRSLPRARTASEPRPARLNARLVRDDSTRRARRMTLASGLW
ncbi:hypothetical protein [Oceaniglobus roseus]|uniref:hypothetical protein n=1 Tax=Oceaniglobus roseus TaxID=1737570 RepID=UPI0012FFDA83|nr:hypothetical protein [Kandeliimicrobium roseum]